MADEIDDRISNEKGNKADDENHEGASVRPSSSGEYRPRVISPGIAHVGIVKSIVKVGVLVPKVLRYG